MDNGILEKVKKAKQKLEELKQQQTAVNLRLEENKEKFQQARTFLKAKGISSLDQAETEFQEKKTALLSLITETEAKLALLETK